MWNFLFDHFMQRLKWLGRIISVVLRYFNGEIPLSTQIIAKSVVGRRTKFGVSSRVYNSKLSSEVVIGSFCSINDSKLSGNVIIEDYTTINGSTLISRRHEIRIGKFCSVAPDVYMIDINHDMRRRSTHFMYKHIEGIKWKDEIDSKGSITIGNDVWIGKGCVILSGVSVGDGAVIAAGSIVTKDIMPYSVVSGIPAQTIKMRFRDEAIQSLLKEKWWNSDMSVLNEKELSFWNEIDGRGIE